ncbi:MAG: rod shape-determining protein MreC [Chloroflexota bacterium]|nr:rod shape-determining protein MreC [Chloroflexota bacterium]
MALPHEHFRWPGMTTISLRRVLGLVLVFAVVCGGFIALDSRSSALEPVRSGLNEIVSPISSAFYDVLDRPGSQSDLEQQLADAVAERDALRAENSQLKADNVELGQLREMLDVETRNPSVELTMANVINQDPSGNQMFIVIDVGSDDGIREGMAIVSPHYYLGQVTEVSPETSKVMLIVDASQSVGAMLEDSRGAGIVKGQLQLGGYLTMLHVEPENAPSEGEWVVTSDSTEIQTRQVPPNIRIGQVFGEPTVSDQTDTLVIEVRPGVADIGDLTVVYVAVESNE